MSSIADAFLEDFDQEDEEQEQEQSTSSSSTSSTTTTTHTASNDMPPLQSAAHIVGNKRKATDQQGDEDKDGEEGEDGEEDGENEEEDDEDDDDDELDGDENADMNDDDSKEENKNDDHKIKMEDIESKAVSTLLTSARLLNHLTLLSELRLRTDQFNFEEAKLKCNIEKAEDIDKDKEYPYIVLSNELSSEIDADILSLHKYVRDIYSKRYAELESLITNPIEYVKLAKTIANETEMSRVEKLLHGLVPNNLLLTISVTATTTVGKQLSADDLMKMTQACEAVIELDEKKKTLYSYVESRMSVLAPNLSAMLGPSLSARLISLAGNLVKLADMPACNLLILGKKGGKIATGLSRVNTHIHRGLIEQSDIIQKCPPTLRSKAMRLLSGKVTLAARLDAYSKGSDGGQGRELKEDVEKKIAKWQEPAAARAKKALPVPLPPKRKKRGGKRYRKERERMKLTELQKQKNRMLFGKAEVTDDYTGEGYGLLGQEGTGLLRVTAKDTQKLAKRLSQETQKRLKKQKVSGTTTTLLSGTASSISFSNHQGIELVNTEMTRIQQGILTPASGVTTAKIGEKPKYFGTDTPFAKIQQHKDKALNASSSSSNNATFKPPVPKF